MRLFNNTNMRTAMAYTNAVGDKVYPVIVDIKKGIKSTEDIQFVSSDVNTGILSVAFIQGNDNYNVTGADVVCSVMRPDASTLDIPCTVIENNIVEVPLGVNGTSQDGIYSFDFKVFKGGNKVVGTPTMNYSVSLSISNDNTVLEDDRLPVLTMLMTQLTDLKGEARETINQANAATVSSRGATANAIAATNNANAVSERVSQETSEAISRVDNKVNEVETRFNALTSSQQQDAEVIDARTDFKGVVFDSLKERIDYTDKLLRDSTVSTVETDKDFTTVEATSNGYFEDVKLEGKTLVNIAKPTTVTLSNATSSTRTYSIPCNMSRQKGKTYTLFARCTDYSINGANGIKFGNWALSGGTVSDATICKGVGSVVYKFTINENATTTLVQVYIDTGSTEESATLTDFMILEGDHTQNPPSGYIEGLKSVGDGVDEIAVSSVKGDGNLWSIENVYYGDVNTDTGELRPEAPGVITSKQLIPVNSTIIHAIGYDKDETLQFKSFFCYDKFKQYLGISYTNEVLSNTFFIRPRLIKTNFSIIDKSSLNVSLSKTREGLSIQHKSDKKRLLFYNEETQTWEKPILREWDSIEKHTDGKYYYHQRSGEVAFDGSEDWGARNMANENNTIGFGLYLGLPNYDINSLPPIICDRFACLNANALWVGDEEGTAHAGDYLHIRILKSKLSTQDAEGFKQWLQANNVTVVYQLAQEKVYECTNIDLITYANETNYVVESGAIVPRTTLKVHNNISNVVRTLQQKVSLLENKFIEGLKKVLAGDMYSLAELLYPEDFTEETSENGIMLIPFE